MQRLRPLRFLSALLAVGLALAVIAPVAAPACAAMMVEAQSPCCCGDEATNPCPPADETPAMLACCSSVVDLAAPAPDVPAPPVADAPVRALLLAAAPPPVVPRAPIPDGSPPPLRPRLALQILQV